MDATATSNEKIAEALKLLEQAARDKKDELRALAHDKYAHLKDALGEAQHTVADSLAAARKRTLEAAQQARTVGAEKAKQLASEVDTQVREHPWPVIGGVAVVALLIGYVMGRNK